MKIYGFEISYHLLRLLISRRTLRLFILSRRVAEYTENACDARVSLPDGKHGGACAPLRSSCSLRESILITKVALTRGFLSHAETQRTQRTLAMLALACRRLHTNDSDVCFAFSATSA